MGAVERAGLEAPDLEVRAEEFFTARAVVAFAAGDPAMDHDFVANLDVFDFAADCDDDARRVRAGDMGQQDFHARASRAAPRYH